MISKANKAKAQALKPSTANWWMTASVRELRASGSVAIQFVEGANAASPLELVEFARAVALQQLFDHKLFVMELASHALKLLTVPEAIWHSSAAQADERRKLARLECVSRGLQLCCEFMRPVRTGHVDAAIALLAIELTLSHCQAARNAVRSEAAGQALPEPLVPRHRHIIKI